jgi:NADPH2:quinone reductase
VKAIQFDRVGGPDVMHLAEVPKPVVAPGTVLVKNHAVGINFADVSFRRGQYSMTPMFPETPGFEAAGVIEAVGAGVEQLKPGMRVALIAFKSYAEYSLAPAAIVMPLPEFLNFELGAAFPIQVLTAWHMLHTSHHASAGQTVVVHSAAGGVGIVAMQIAKAAGASVIGTVSSASKASLAREYGADDVIDYAATDFGDEVMRLTGGQGADLILDAVGKETFQKGLKCLKPFGHLILFGSAGGPPDPISPSMLSDKSIKISGFGLPVVFRLPETMRRGVEGSFALLREGKLKLLIGKTFPLAQAAEAHRHMESRQSVGKLLLIP